MGIESEKIDSRSYRIKEFLDGLLPAVLILLSLYLYLEFLASNSFALYPYRTYIQFSLLTYFVTELIVLFSMYESNKTFFRNHWLDIMLTVPFFSAFKGLKGLKLFKSVKGTKSLKLGKALKSSKIAQKIGKLLKKGRKQLKKASKN